MAVVINSVEPQFIMVQYDISQDDERTMFRELLLSCGAQMWSYSVYYMKFSTGLLAEIRALQAMAKSKTYRVKITTPAFPGEQYNEILAEYEAGFVADLEDARKALDWVELALADDEDLVAEHGGKPYTAAQIRQRIRAAEHALTITEKGLAKRKMYEGTDERLTKVFEGYERMIRKIRAFADALTASCKARAAREATA